VRKILTLAIVVGVVLLAAAVWLFSLPAVAVDGPVSTDAAAINRGQYLVAAGGCRSCHMAEGNPAALSGGLTLETDFGVFVTPNITPDPETGIGNWSARDFLLAVRHGRRPAGGFYFPAFPYRAYAGMSDQDVLDIGAYLMAQPAVRSEIANHETPWWLQRWMIAGWNRLADLRQTELTTPTEPEAARGAYLARNLGHCGECHTPRDGLGIPDLANEFGGAQLDGKEVEAIDRKALKNWTVDDFAFFLLVGMAPDGDSIGGEMESVIEHNTSKLTKGDRNALAAFFTRK
jgi:mono/diheme cytochrome c family protein